MNTVYQNTNLSNTNTNLSSANLSESSRAVKAIEQNRQFMNAASDDAETLDLVNIFNKFMKKSDETAESAL